MSKQSDSPSPSVTDQELPMSLCACLSRIYKTVSKRGFNIASAAELGGDATHVAEAFGIDPKSAILLAGIIERAGMCGSADDQDLSAYLGCTNIEFLEHHGRLHSMEKAGIIQINNGNREYFRVTNEALKAIEKDTRFVPIKNTDLSPTEFATRFLRIFHLYCESGGDLDSLYENINYLIQNNPQLTFCKKVLESELYRSCCIGERRMFFYLCYSYLKEGSQNEDLEMLLSFSGEMLDPFYYKKEFGKEQTSLQQGGLVTCGIEDGMANPNLVSLSDEVRDEFLCEMEPGSTESPQYKDLVKVSSIAEKELFFNEAESLQINRLAGLLEDSNFRKVQERLSETGMRKGFNVLLYGPPGTGKTACAYELARRSGRDIFVVDVTKLRSKWVGDSEKSVKCVFRIYRKLCKTEEKAPILLFNEADAIFSKRFEDVEHSVDQLNNTIQNIILQEMENLEGILIATTNLANNLDAAFERRFIFKVEIRKPQKESRAKIWHSMIQDLSLEEAETLASRYEFSGGNIENIARKSAVEYVLTGEKPNLGMLDQLCRDESINKSGVRQKIGF